MFIRCVQLIEPALSKRQAQYIERLLAIYLDDNSQNSNPPFDDDKIHTIEDYTPKCVPNPVETADIEGSIWKQTPGKKCPFICGMKSLALKIVCINQDDIICLFQMVLIGSHAQLEVFHDCAFDQFLISCFLNERKIKNTKPHIYILLTLTLITAQKSCDNNKLAFYFHRNRKKKIVHFHCVCDGL